MSVKYSTEGGGGGHDQSQDQLQDRAAGMTVCAKAKAGWLTVPATVKTRFACPMAWLRASPPTSLLSAAASESKVCEEGRLTGVKTK